MKALSAASLSVAQWPVFGNPFCPKEMSVGWRYVGQSQNVYAKVAHFKKWLKQQESVCGKMRWSSDV